MRLFQAKERESVVKKEKDLTQRKALELSQEINELVKSFNATKEDLGLKKKKIFEDYRNFRDEIQKEREKLEERIKQLKKECEIALEPLYSKERIIARKEELLSEKLNEIEQREKDIKIREKNVSELEKWCNIAFQSIDKKEKYFIEREKHLEERRLHFEASRQRHEKFFKQNQQKLRDWLERERIKLREGK